MAKDQLDLELEASFFSSSIIDINTYTYTYDVFLSYRGADTHNNFTYNLYNNLLQNGIKTYLYRRGEEISLPMLLKVIEQSRTSIVVFSENFASSEWCLNELVKILECRKSQQQIVWPVYYKVDPSDVRNQRGTFSEALATHECTFKDDMEKVLRWRAALTEASHLPGWYLLHGQDYQFTRNIVEEISVQVFNRTYLNVAKYPIGIESRVQDMNELLGIGVNDVRMVGIWGPEGIGKTTIAKAVYNSIAHSFQGSCFLENIRESSKAHGGLVQLQMMAFSEILGDKQLEVSSVFWGINKMKKMFSKKKVLLILDGVNQIEQLQKLAGGCDWFGLGSRIIITTKDKGLLTDHRVSLMYKVNELDFDEALELFSWNAFQQNKHPDDYAILATRVVGQAQGLPLALILLGSLLRSWSMDQWSTALEAYEKVLNLDFQEVLKISYNALKDPEKEVFLDIACFLNGKEKNYVTKMLQSCHLHPQFAVEVLVEKALINTEDTHIWMHELLEKMGKEIVRGDSLTEPGKRSRSWFYKDVNHVLMENTDTGKVKGITAKLTDPNEIYSSVKSISKATWDKWAFLITTLCLEILSLAFDQASSPSKPHYAQIGMILAFAGVIISFWELIHKAKKERAELRRWGLLWWFYHPRSDGYRVFGSLPEIYALLGSISQCICSTFQYVWYTRHRQNPIQVSLWPAIFVVSLAVSRLSWTRINETIDQND